MKSLLATSTKPREAKFELPLKLVPPVSVVEEPPTKEMTVGYILRDIGNGSEVLLGQRGEDTLFQPSVRNGAGGKFEDDKDDTMEDCLVRESWEEVGVRVDRDHVVHIATIEFFHFTPQGYRQTPNCRVHFYNVHKWTCRGEPKAREKKKKGFSRVDWFPRTLTGMPYSKMNADVIHWHPSLLADNEQRIMKAKVWYADADYKQVYRVEADYVPRPALPTRRHRRKK